MVMKFSLTKTQCRNFIERYFTAKWVFQYVPSDCKHFKSTFKIEKIWYRSNMLNCNTSEVTSCITNSLHIQTIFSFPIVVEFPTINSCCSIFIFWFFNPQYFPINATTTITETTMECVANLCTLALHLSNVWGNCSIGLFMLLTACTTTQTELWKSIILTLWDTELPI